MTRKALGKGLDALLPAAPGKSGLLEIEIDQIRPNSFQPRLRMEPERLQELADSIAENGVLQPIIVRRTGEGFELVAGERRWRAAQKAGLGRIPALVQDLSDQKLLQLALVENIQRDELSAIEEAHAYRMLVEEFSLSQEEVARRVGRSRSAVANTLRLLKLPKDVQQMVLAGELSMGHARALLPLPLKDQLQISRKASAGGLSVRQLERRVQQLLKKPPRTPSLPADPHLQAAEQQLEEHWKTRVTIRRRGKGGQIILYFHSDEELDRLFEALTTTAT